MTPQEIHAMLKQIRYDLSVTQTRVDEAIRAVATLPAEPEPELKCMTCGLPTKSRFRLAEHLYVSHGGPVPDHYLAAELAAGC